MRVENAQGDFYGHVIANLEVKILAFIKVMPFARTAAHLKPAIPSKRMPANSFNLVQTTSEIP
ncbi:MAG: hypothetical protein A2603_04935 [Bdellovibrionales bacterium RIFOXYD1_FULL_55_31]|nr:MAG: hypothetical protein A2603_04935 [Bdellovibrionales bacterium RIFOXYD1_FULL_55_31]